MKIPSLRCFLAAWSVFHVVSGLGIELDSLNEHSKARNNVDPPAAQMNSLVWNASLASLAQQWASQCTFAHTPDGYPSVGENIFASTYNATMQNAVDAWVAEKQWYTYETNTCSPTPGNTCGHYTQVVWAMSSNLGCGKQECDTNSPFGNQLWYIIVCFYDPAGNIIGAHPYNRATDACSQNPCQNNGACIDLQDGNYTCECPAGFSGTLCELVVEMCANNPCQNDGNCINLPNGFSCVCAPGYTGPTCDIDIDDCANVMCPNGANCVDLVNDYECVCPEGENCGDANAAAAGSSSQNGDPHIVTFDGAKLTYQGPCRYVLIRTDDRKVDDLSSFAINVRNQNTNKKVSLLEDVEVIVGKRKVRATIHGEVYVDGVVVDQQKLPLKTGAFTIMRDLRGNVLKASPKRAVNEPVIRIETTLLVNATITMLGTDGRGSHFMNIEVPTAYRGKVQGLGGNFNGIHEDDYVLADGTDVRDILPPDFRSQMIADSWLVKDDPDNYRYPCRAA